jgi:copper oxidase (laccase) domain-containing protein
MPATFQLSKNPSDNFAVNFVVSHRADGDFNSDVVELSILNTRRRALVDLPWTQLNEVHGLEARWVSDAGECDRETGDVVGTTLDHAVLGIWVGDCAPVILIGNHSIVAAHAGWKGLRDGVLDSAVALMSEHGDQVIEGFVGPHIQQCCYEFGEQDLETMVNQFGESARGCDRQGKPALDVAACIRQFFDARKVPLFETGECTGCLSDKYFSHRVRGERERHIVGVWRTS